MEQEKKKIKVCWVTNIDKSAKFILLPYLKFLKNEGFDVHLACSKGDFTSALEEAGLKVKSIEIKRKITPFYDLITLFRLWSYFRKEKFDIVHTHTPKPGLLGQLAAKLAGVPIIANTVHGFYFQKSDPFLKRKFFIFVERIAAFCSSIIFFVNYEDMGTVLEEKISKKEKIKYFGGGIDMERFDPKRFSEDFILKKRANLKIKPGQKVVGIVARLVAEKGYLDLFSAFKLVLKKHPSALLLIIGQEEPEKKDRININIVKEYGIEKNVLYLGERQDIDEVFSLMDVFVLPSYREGLGISLLEAEAMEKPVIATNIRGCKEAVDNNKTGMLIFPKTPRKLAEAINKLLSDPKEAKKMGIEGRKKVLSEFDEKLVFDRIIKEYNRLIKERLKNDSADSEKNF